MTIASFIVIAALSVLGVAALVEFYKKTIRKGQAAKWENWLVGAVLSAGIAYLDCTKGLAFLFVDNIAFNVIIYAVIFFVAQLFLDMKFIKQIISSALSGMDIEKFFYLVIDKLGISLDKIKSVLQQLDVTREKLEKALLDAGFPADKVKTLLDILFN